MSNRSFMKLPGLDFWCQEAVGVGVWGNGFGWIRGMDFPLPLWAKSTIVRTFQNPNSHLDTELFLTVWGMGGKKKKQGGLEWFFLFFKIPVASFDYDDLSIFLYILNIIPEIHAA